MDDRRSDDPGRRGEDKRWANMQVQLATTHRVISTLEASVEDLKDELKILDTSLYGGAREKESFSARLKTVENQTMEIYRVVIGDHAGMGGLKRMVEGMNTELEIIHKSIDTIKESKKDRTARLSAIWIAAISTFGLMATNLDNVAVGVERMVQVVGISRKPFSAEEIRREVEALKKSRGPEVQKRLKEIERAARGH